MSIFDPGPVVILVSCGLFVGFAQGFLGVGGSFIMVPVTVVVFQWMNVPSELGVKLAFGTSLAVVFVSALRSSLEHSKRGKVWWKAAVSFGLAGSVGALVGATLTARYLPGDIMGTVFGIILLLVVVRLLISSPPKTLDTPESLVAFWLLGGFGIGMISGLLGIGGGILALPLMTLGFKFGIHRAVGTSIGMMVFTSGAGALGYILNGWGMTGLPELSLGLVHVPAWGMMAAASIVTSASGARSTHRLSARVMVPILAGLMTYLGLRMIGLFEWLGLPL